MFPCHDNPSHINKDAIKRPASRDIARLRDVALLLSLSQELANSRTHDSKDLKDHDVGQDNAEEGQDEENLDPKLDKAAASLPVEALPGIEELDIAGATEDLRHDLAAKGAVEGDNGVLILWQDRGFHADESGDGGEAQEDGGAEGDANDGDDAGNNRGPLCTAVVAEILVLQAVQAEKDGEELDDEERNVGHGGIKGSNRRQELPVRAGGDTLQELGVCGCGDDLVRPGGMEVGTHGTADSADEDEAEGNREEEAGKDGIEDVGAAADAEAPDDAKPQATEAGKTAGLRDEVAKGAPDGRGNGLLVDEGAGRGRLEEALLDILGGGRGFVGGRYGDGGGGRLNHAERGHNIFERVLDLGAVSNSLTPKGHSVSSYQADEQDDGEEGDGNHAHSPRRYLDLRVIALGGSLDKVQRRGMLQPAADDVLNHVVGTFDGDARDKTRNKKKILKKQRLAIERW